ncbi:MAG: hypothetical protein EON93_07645, partial [Burkholderiales bacterium]
MSSPRLKFSPGDTIPFELRMALFHSVDSEQLTGVLAQEERRFGYGDCRRYTEALQGLPKLLGCRIWSSLEGVRIRVLHVPALQAAEQAKAERLAACVPFADSRTAMRMEAIAHG